MKKIAMGWIFNDHNEILFTFHTKHQRWQHVGGHVNHGELFEDALFREVQEETQLDITILGPPLPGKDAVRVLHTPFVMWVDEKKLVYEYVCIATNPAEIVLQKEELEEHKWVSRERIDTLDCLEEFKRLAKQAWEYKKEYEEKYSNHVR